MVGSEEKLYSFSCNDSIAKTPQSLPCSVLKLLGFWSVVLSSLSYRGLIAYLISWYRKSNKYFQRPDYSVFLSVHVSNADLASICLSEKVCLGPTLFGLHILLWFYSWILLREKWSLRFGTFLSVKVVWESNEDAFREDGERQNIELIADHEINEHYPNHVWADYNRFPQTQCEDFLENAYVCFDWKCLILPIFKTIFCKTDAYDGKLQRQI